MKILKIILDNILNITSILLRLFPFSHPVQLIKFGNPSKDSPVFVSGNWYHTVFRLKKVLKNQDCYLLVADSAGINVWCAAGVGDYNEHKIADAVNAFGLKELVDHRTLTLPQLSAVGIDKANLEKECGFKVKWGPVCMYDIREFINNGQKVTEKMKLIKWKPKDTFLIAVGKVFAYYIMYIYYIIFALIFGTQYNKFAIYTGVVIFLTTMSTGFRLEKPFKWPGTYPFVVGMLILAGINVYGFFFNTAIKGDLLVYSALTLISTIIVFADMTANDYYKTKLWHWISTFNTMSLFQPKVTKDCISCSECIHVCPKGIFSLEDKNISVDLSRICCECLACVRQCPTDAIRNITGKYKKDIKVIPNIEEIMK